MTIDVKDCDENDHRFGQMRQNLSSGIGRITLQGGNTMKQNWKQIAIAGVMGLAVPGIIMSLKDRRTEIIAIPQAKPVATAAMTEPESESEGVRIPVLTASGQTEMELEEYLLGVVLAEMPVNFAPEAHKAQAVVARTYAMKRCTAGPKHPGNAVCTDPACCQSYLAPGDYLAAGGDMAALSRLREEISRTAGEVLTFGEELIEATYFSCSGGTTEDALAVWGADIPYLQSTASPGEESAAHYTDTVQFSPEAFQTALGTGLSGSPESWFGETRYTDGGGVETMVIGGETYSGTELRRLLGLRSTAFTVEAAPECITVTTWGYGHRVGMSQYGADAMAEAGWSYREILAHYYQGTEVAELTDLFDIEDASFLIKSVDK